MTKHLVALSLCAVLTAPGCCEYPKIQHERPRPAERVASELEITIEEAEALGQEITKSIESGDSSVLNDHIDLGQFIDTVLTGIDMRAADRGEFANGLNNTFDFGNTVLTDVAGGSYSFRRAEQHGASVTLLFRLLSPRGECNYHELKLAKWHGRLKVCDVFAYSSGDLLTTTMRRVSLPLLEAGGFLKNAQLTANERALAADARVASFVRLALAANCDEAFAIYDGLEPEIKKEKGLFALRLKCANQIGVVAIDACLADALEFYSSDLTMALVLIDPCFVAKRWDEALEYTRVLVERFGPDGYLSSLRSAVLLAAGRVEDAITEATNGIAVEPKLPSCHWALVQIGLTAKRFDLVRASLLRLERECQVPIGDLAGAEGFEEFVQSDAYKPWLVERNKKN